MKSTLLSIAIFFALVFQGIAQTPQKISYQAVLRNADGTVIASQPVDVKITLKKAASNGTIVYTETFSQNTSAQGAVSLSIGEGDAVSFAAIPWGENIFIQTEVKKSSDLTYNDLGTTQILSVPYALTAGSVKEVKSLPGSNVDDPIFVVKNNDGQIVFAVYQDGVRVNIDDSGITKGARGGFAVGGLSQAKGSLQEYLRITPDSARIYINDSNSKGARGGFAVGGLSQSKGITQEYFKVTSDTSYFKTTLFTESNIISTGTINTGAGVASTPVTDFDGNTYQTVKIGNQIWMKENLRTTHYSYGSAISGEAAVYNNSVDVDTLKTYGMLYSNLVIIDTANVCPNGWHVPTYQDWDTLMVTVGGPYWLTTPIVTGLKLMEKGTTVNSTGSWSNDNNANNVSGFSGRPGGQAMVSALWFFNGIGLEGNWWDSAGGHITLNGSTGEVGKLEPMSGYSYSIRCVKGKRQPAK